MATIEINIEQLVPWCERRGIDARVFVAETPETWRSSRGIHYRLRRFTGDPDKRLFVVVVAPFDDPMPDIHVLSGAAGQDHVTL
jgi:hypothetical protein